MGGCTHWWGVVGICVRVCECVHAFMYTLTLAHTPATRQLNSPTRMYLCTHLYIGLLGSSATLHLTRGGEVLNPVSIVRKSGSLGVGLVVVRDP